MKKSQIKKCAFIFVNFVAFPHFLPVYAFTSQRPFTSTVAYTRSNSFTTPFPNNFDSLSRQSPNMGPLALTREIAEAVAGPFFGISLFPYLAFLYLLNVPENNTPKGVTVGFAFLLSFVFLTIPAAIAAETLYGVSLADCDWLHGSAESLLTITNLVTVVAFRQALGAMERGDDPPKSAKEYGPMVLLTLCLTALCGVTALLPSLGIGDVGSTFVHTPYLGGFMDLPRDDISSLIGQEPDNALTVACWIIHVSSLVEFLVAMGFAWRWADVTGNPRWKGLTWGLLPLHSSGITACTYHLFYNQMPVLVPLQAMLTCLGNTTAAYAAYRIAISNGWKPPKELWGVSVPQVLLHDNYDSENLAVGSLSQVDVVESVAPVGFEDIGDVLAGDNDYSFLLKLFVGCAVGSYAVKYGGLAIGLPLYSGLDGSTGTALAVIGIPSSLNAYKWYRRSRDSSFEGWF